MPSAFAFGVAIWLSSGASLAQDPSAEAGLSVEVVGEPPPVEGTRVRTGQAGGVAGAFGDPFRVVEAMPGVTPTASGVPYYFVRGAPPGNLGTIIDGVEVPTLFHVGLGPSVVPASWIREVSFYPGPYPIEHGGYAGAVVAAKTSVPRPGWHGTAMLRLFDAGATVQAPFDDDRGYASVGGRYSFAGALFSAVSPSTALSYWDYQARSGYAVSPQDTISMLSFGSFDFLGEKEGDTIQTLVDSEFHRVDLRYDRSNDASRARVGATLGYDVTRGTRLRRIEDRSLSLRAESETTLDSDWTLVAGADFGLDDYDSQFNDPRVCLDGGCFGLDASREAQIDVTFAELFPSRLDLETGAYLGLRYELDQGTTIAPGIRTDFYASQSRTAVGVDPRLSVRVRLNDRVFLLPAVGLTHQLPSFLPATGFQIAGIRGGLQRALMASYGVETHLDRFTQLTVTGFRSVIFNLSDPLGTTRGGGLGVGRFTQRATGITTGGEVFLRRSLSRRIGGTLSYTLSRSTRQVGGRTLPSAYDRTHVLNAAVSYKLGRGWRAGVRYVFYTGFPADELNLYVPRSESPDRVRSFYRFDGRVEKRWAVGDGYWGLHFELQNATFSREVIDVQCEELGCEEVDVGPITIPSIGVEGGF